MLDCKYITTAFNLQNFFTVIAKIEKKFQKFQKLQKARIDMLIKRLKNKHNYLQKNEHTETK